MSDTSSFEPSDLSSHASSSDENDHEEEKEKNKGEQETGQVKRGKSPKAPSSSIQRDEQSYTIKQEAIKELHHCLDHVIAHGNQIWQDAKRCNNWMKRMEKNPQPLGFRATPQRDWDYHIQDEVRNPKVAVHIEDVVLYSNMNHVKYVNLYGECNLKRSRTNKAPAVLFLWPVDCDDLEERETEGAKSNVDHEWEHYFGDGLDEIEFRRYRSRKRKFSDLIGDIHTKSLKKEGERELQDLIQRSWDKAVHIASNVFDTNISTGIGENSSQNGKTMNENKSGNECKEASTDRLIQAQAVLRCKELGIEFDPIYITEHDPYYTCQSCNKRLRFHSREKVIVHLFGSITDRGCCWDRIRQEQERIAQKVLENEALNIIDNLLHIVFKSLKQRNDQDKDRQDDPMNWLDVCNCIIETLEKATHVQQFMKNENDFAMQLFSSPERVAHYNGSYGHVNKSGNLGKNTQVVERSDLQTIQIDQDLLPFVLNKDIMQIVLSRLISRYDDRLNKY